MTARREGADRPHTHLVDVTAAIIAHTLGVTYGAAQQLAAEYDKAHGGHGPSKLVRLADGIRLPGYTVKDGRQAKPKAKTVKAKVTA